MEIVIGATPRVGAPVKRNSASGGGYIEAKVLNVRSPRRRQERAPNQGDRRTQKNATDPVSGRVMTLMVPEGYNIPGDIESGNYRIFLRFAPRRG